MGGAVLSRADLAVLALASFGLSFSWACEFATQTAYMLSLGLSRSLATFTWVAGPISGLVVQPIVGSLSDRTESRLGKRVPFLVGGLLVAVAAQFVYAWSLWAGQALGDRGCDRDIALLLATVSFWVMDCANNVLQLPARALVADLASEEQQELGQALVSLWSAVGSVAAFAAAALVDPVGRIRGYFGLASALLVCSCTATIVVALRAQKGAPERGRGSSSPGEDSERASLLGHGSVNAQAERRTGLAEDGDPFLVSVLEPLWTVLNLPHSMRALCAVQFLAWAAWFCYMPNWGAWMGSDIFDGHPRDPGGCHGAAPPALLSPNSSTAAALSADRFTEGMQRGSFGQAMASILQFLASVLAPAASLSLGTGRVFAGSMFLLAAVFAAMAALPSHATAHWSPQGAVALQALTGIPLAATNVYPFALVGRHFRGTRTLGLHMSVLNVFIVLPQLLDTAYTGLLADWLGWGAVLFVGAGWATAAGCVAAISLEG